MQGLAGVVRVPGADHNVVGPHGPQAVTCPGPEVGQPGRALDAGATQERAEELGLGLATGNLNYDPVVGASHRQPPNSGPAPRSSGCTPRSVVDRVLSARPTSGGYATAELGEVLLDGWSRSSPSLTRT